MKRFQDTHCALVALHQQLRDAGNSAEVAIDLEDLPSRLIRVGMQVEERSRREIVE
jgi:hypothetical protein